MKLVELLAMELGEWADTTVCYVQDPDGSVWPCKETAYRDGDSWVGDHGLIDQMDDAKHFEEAEVCSDHDTAIVTKKMWQAERDRQKGGEWKRHRGGKQPVSDDVRVEFKFRSGVTGECYADNLLWDHQKQDDDVMQYRVISQPQADEVEYRGPFPCAPIGESVNAMEFDIEFPSGVCGVESKTEQMETPFKWRDQVTELNAYIEKFTRERDELIERLGSEGFALIPPVVSVVSEFAGVSLPIEEWQIGDIVEVVSVSDESSAPLGVFKITDIYATEPKYELDHEYFPNYYQMKFIRRP